MLLQAKNLGIAFHGKWVFRGVDISVESGDRLALVGPSGCGKTLCLKALALLQPLTEGSVQWNGRPIRGNGVPPFRTNVMYVPQRTSDDDGSVQDFLSLPFSFAANSKKSFDLTAARQLLGQLGRGDDFLTKTQRDLSGGERQIAAIVRALLLSPKILLLDEPTAAMDGNTASAAEQLVSQWCAEDSDRSVVWITHDLKQAKRVSRSVIEFEKIGDRPILS